MVVIMQENTHRVAALVINLATSTERMAFQTQQLQALGICFSRVNAVSTNEITPERYEQHANSWERKMRPAEVACFLSHLAAWEKVVQDNQPYLILEDDALLAKNTAALLEALPKKITPTWQPDMLTLEVRGRKKLVAKEQVAITPVYQARRLYQDRTGAAGYVLFPQGAKKLLAQYKQKGAALADAFLCRSYELASYQIEPAAIIQLDMCDTYDVPSQFTTSSTISNHKAKPKANNLVQQLGFKRKRISSQIRMGLRMLSKKHKADYRFIQVDNTAF